MSEVDDSARWLTGQLTANRNAVKALSAPQLGTSSIEAGAIEEYDVEGTLASVTGEQFDGTHAAVTLAGPTPPEPVPPTVTTGSGQATVRWSGKFADDALSPMDFSHVAVHASRLESFDPDNTTQVATITGESGDTATVLLDTGEWYFLLVAVSKAGKWSDPSEAVLAEVADTMTPTDVQDALLDLDTGLAAAQATADGKNTIIRQTTVPMVTAGFVDGDRWEVWTTLAEGGMLTGTWRFDGTQWILDALDPSYLPLVDIGSGTFGLLSGGRLVAKSITADLLAAVIVLASDVIAGNPDATHAKMTPTGFKVLTLPPGFTAPVEVIRMGTDSDDYFGVTNAAGESVAAISSTGDIAANSLDAATGISIGGTPVLETVDAAGGALKAWASRASDGLYYAGTTPHPYLSLQLDGVRAGRAYMVSTSPIAVKSDAASSDAVVNMHYVANVDRPAKITDPIIDRGTAIPAGWNTSLRNPVTFNRIITPATDGFASILLSYGVETTGRAKITTAGGRGVFLTVTDMGWAPPETGENRDGTADAPAGGSTGGETTSPTVSKKNYDQTWNATGIRSFLGNGGTYAYNTGYMYSGLQPGTGNGDLSSMAVFPSLTSTLSGATVTGVWVYVYYDFWYQGSGGDAYIGLHGQAGLTSTAPAKTYAHAVSAGWPRAAGRWVKMSSSTYDGFRTGQHRGFTLGGSGGGYERYGYAHAAKLRITWTK